MKTLEQIQEFNRKKIICAVNGTENYEEALKKEEGDSCHYLYKTNFGEREIVGDARRCGYNREKHHPDAFLLKVIGKPLTLDRVLIAIRQCGFNADLWFGEDIGFLNFGLFKDLSWDLTKRTLEEQSEEIQRAIYELMGGQK